MPNKSGYKSKSSKKGKPSGGDRKVAMADARRRMKKNPKKA